MLFPQNTTAGMKLAFRDLPWQTNKHILAHVLKHLRQIDYSTVIGEHQFWLQTNFPLSICESDFGVIKFHRVTCDKQAATDHIQKS